MNNAPSVLQWLQGTTSHSVENGTVDSMVGMDDNSSRISMAHLI